MAVDAIGGALLVVLSGAMDASACGQLEECLQQAARGGRAVVLDLAEAETLPRRAIEAIVAARERLGVRLRVVAPRGGAAQRALKAAGVAHTLAIHSSRPGALTDAAGR
jgi:anti-anti-sigma regulatory factor